MNGKQDREEERKLMMENQILYNFLFPMGGSGWSGGCTPERRDCDRMARRGNLAV